MQMNPLHVCLTMVQHCLHIIFTKGTFAFARKHVRYCRCWFFPLCFHHRRRKLPWRVSKENKTFNPLTQKAGVVASVQQEDAVSLYYVAVKYLPSKDYLRVNSLENILSCFTEIKAAKSARF